MNANEKVLNTFATRVRQMILQYEEVKKKTPICVSWWVNVIKRLKSSKHN